MSRQFLLTKVTPLGEADPKYGQTYWGEVAEQLEPVMFNLMNSSVEVGDRLECEDVLLKTSSKGKDYHRLKKVKVIGGGGISAPKPAANDQLGELLQLVREIHAATVTKTVPKVENKVDEVFPVNEEEPFDMSSIPF